MGPGQAEGSRLWLSLSITRLHVVCTRGTGMAPLSKTTAPQKLSSNSTEKELEKETKRPSGYFSSRVTSSLDPTGLGVRLHGFPTIQMGQLDSSRALRSWGEASAPHPQAPWIQKALQPGSTGCNHGTRASAVPWGIARLPHLLL